jgi:hypothetical protein
MWKLLLRCTCVATSFLFMIGVLKFLYENRGIALPRSFHGVFKLIKGGICVGVFGYQAPRWDNEKNKNSVSVYTDLLVVSPAGEKKLLPVIALVALENFLQKLTHNPGFKMDWTHCALDLVWAVNLKPGNGPLFPEHPVSSILARELVQLPDFVGAGCLVRV